MQIYDKYDEIKLGEEVYEIVEKGISVKNQEFGISDKLHSMSKSLNYQVPDRIKCDVKVNIRKSRLKDVNVMAFMGGFIANFIIPDHIGIGKSVSRGFGAVRRHTLNENVSRIKEHFKGLLSDILKFLLGPYCGFKKNSTFELRYSQH